VCGAQNGPAGAAVTAGGGDGTEELGHDSRLGAAACSATGRSESCWAHTIRSNGWEVIVSMESVGKGHGASGTT
jgi:hypothetical protein